jgi:hypothetical protein
MTIDISKFINQEDALRYIVEHLHFKMHEPTNTKLGVEYGYDLYLPNVMRKWIRDHCTQLDVQDYAADQYLPEASPFFYEASWELCRIGVLRPGIQKWGEQSTVDGSAGNGYSITPFGKTWLKETNKDSYVPTEPGRFSEMLSPFSNTFGPGFHERAQQAIRCYGAHTYLACCVMCGAAVESILLHLAIKKDGNEANILKQYRAGNGRKKLEDLIVGQQTGSIKNDFEVCFGLLKYWRDEAAHGRTSNISENEAYTSLALLLRCAQFAKDNYEILTSP